jgi:MHS family proline/betaine transporter-like MFS transporter
MTINTSKTQHSLTREQKEAVGLLSIGTFLEYFDLMLYVHMAVLLNELFFPQYDPFTNSLLAAFAFCSTYLLRPFGALIFGYLGDLVGRKTVLILTTFVMACSCCIIAILPTYDQIGLTASVIITICRMLQGLSSMGEVVASEIYLTELIKKPYVYPSVALLTIGCILGGTIALIVSFIAVKNEYIWRGAFFLGAIVAIVGFKARMSLKESAVFANARKRLKEHSPPKANNYFLKIDYKTVISYLFMQCTWPTCFYFSFIYCSDILKNQFNYSIQEIIAHNLLVSVLQLIAFIIFCVMSYKISPIKILRYRLWIFSVFIVICPYLLDIANSPFYILFIQSFMLIFSSTDIPAAPIIYSHFPILQRFRYTVFIYAISRLIMYTVGSFGILYLVRIFGNWGILIIMLPLTIGVLLAVSHFQKLEEKELASL